MSKEEKIRKILYGKGKANDTLDEMSVEVLSHREVKEDIFNYFVDKGINKYRAGIVTNMIMNKAIYNVEYPPDVEKLIDIALREVED